MADLTIHTIKGGFAVPPTEDWPPIGETVLGILIAFNPARWHKYTEVTGGKDQKS